MREPETGRVRDVEFISIGTLHLVESYQLYFSRDYEKYENNETNEIPKTFVCFVIFVNFVILLQYISSSDGKILTFPFASCFFVCSVFSCACHSTIIRKERNKTRETNPGITLNYSIAVFCQCYSRSGDRELSCPS